MALTATTLLIAGLAATAVGAGVTAYGQYQQGKTQNAIAQFNALQQEKQAKQQLLSMQVQTALQKQQAEANFAMRSAEANARLGNAEAIEDQALTQDAINRVNLRKRREEFERLQGEQRANIAGSGIAESSGTPLDLLAETAGRIQLDQEEQFSAGEAHRRTLFAEAAKERLGGKLALIGATLDRDSGLAQAALRDATGKAEYQAGLRTAELTRLTGRAAKQAANYQAISTIVSSHADAGRMAGTFALS